jgi:RNA polymerase sigma-70 factor, ECF subfamily
VDGLLLFFPVTQPFHRSPCLTVDHERACPDHRSRVDDSQLIHRVLAGEAAAERELFDRHVDRVYRLAFRLTGHDDLAQDCTQDTFIRAFERLHTFRGDSSLSTWLHAIAVSVTLNALRKVKRFRLRETELTAASQVGGAVGSAEPDIKTRLAQAIDSLPEGYRTVFVMHDVEGYTHEEIGAALGVQVGTSKAQLFRARAKLREMLADFAGEWAV